MLSVHTINTGGGMSSYHDLDDYYAKGDPEAQRASEWFGKGAELSGLQGHIAPEEFSRILDGYTPDGGRLGRAGEDDAWVHRAGTDLTFSAPKSVSIMALVAGDTRLTAAHDKAVRDTMAHIEKNASFTRIRNGPDGAQQRVQVDNITAALFRHEVNRNQDPQLHTHVVVANMVQDADGKWRSGMNQAFYDRKMEFGAHYRAELAMNIREVGYRIERTGNGFFEIAGVSKELMTAFSSRRAEIVEAISGFRDQSAEAMARAALMTRNHRIDVKRDELLQKWRERTEDMNIDVSSGIVGGGAAVEQAKGLREQAYNREQNAIADRIAVRVQAEQTEEAHSGHHSGHRSGHPTDQKQAPRDYINVPYEDRGRAKALGARWDSREKSWYVPEGVDGNVFKAWREAKSDVSWRVVAGVNVGAGFGSFLSASGVAIKGQPVMDGQWYRVRLKDDKKGAMSASYRGFSDGVPNGQLKNFRDGGAPLKWTLARENMTADRVAPQQAEQIQADREARITQQQADLLKRHEATAERAGTLLDKATATSSGHPYLRNKQISAHGLTQGRDGRLLVPVRDETGRVWNVQTIDESGNKRFLKGGAKAGHYHVIGQMAGQTNGQMAGQADAGDKKLADSPVIAIAEGYATAASVHEATQIPAIVAFDAGNLKEVAGKIRSAYPDKGIIIVADNDHKTKGNPGLTRATEAATAVGGVMVHPAFDKSELENKLTDFNDLARSRGQQGPVAIRDALRSASEASLEQVKAFEQAIVIHDRSKGVGEAAPDGAIALATAQGAASPQAGANSLPVELNTVERGAEGPVSVEQKAERDIEEADRLIGAPDPVLGTHMEANGQGAGSLIDRLRTIFSNNDSGHGIMSSPEPGGSGELRSEEPGGDVTRDELAAREIVDYAISHLSERASVFAEAELKKVALGEATGFVRPHEIDRAIEHMTATKQLVASRHSRHQGAPHFTTLAALKTEKETIQSMKTAQHTIKPFLKPAAVNKGLKNTPLNEGLKEGLEGGLNEGQQDAVRAMLTGTDRVIGVQGYAGVGKTTMLRTVRQIAEGNSYQMMGLAPSSSAVKTMARETGIRSGTLQGFLGKYAGYAEGRGRDAGKHKTRSAFQKTMIVVDESSLASSTQIRDFMRIVEQIRPARVVLVGDEKQLDAVDAGRPFGQLQDHGMKTVRVGAIMRQKNPELKEAVYNSLGGDIRKAFEKISHNIHVADRPEPAIMPGKTSRHKATKIEPGKADYDQALAHKTFEVWNAMPVQVRDRAGIAAPTHALRHAINEKVREQLGEEGRLQGPARDLSTFRSAGHTNAEKGRAITYRGDKAVIFNRGVPEYGIKQGDIATVYGINEKDNSVALVTGEGEVITRKLTKGGAGHHMDILEKGTLNIRQGDRIRFTRNDEANGITNSDQARITSIAEDGKVTFQKEDGSQITLGKGAAALQFIDHAYAATVHAFQGRTVDDIIGVMQAGHPRLTTQKAFYVEISRARHSANLITDDREKLAQTLLRETGERVAALEALSPAIQAQKDLLPSHKDREHGVAIGNPAVGDGNNRDTATLDTDANRGNDYREDNRDMGDHGARDHAEQDSTNNKSQNMPEPEQDPAYHEGLEQMANEIAGMIPDMAPHDGPGLGPSSGNEGSNRERNNPDLDKEMSGVPQDKHHHVHHELEL